VSVATVAVANVNDFSHAYRYCAHGPHVERIEDLSDADGMGAIAYQWLRNREVVFGATQAEFTLALADVGATIAVSASSRDGQDRDGQGTKKRVLNAPPPRPCCQDRREFW